MEGGRRLVRWPPQRPRCKVVRAGLGFRPRSSRQGWWQDSGPRWSEEGTVNRMVDCRGRLFQREEEFRFRCGTWADIWEEGGGSDWTVKPFSFLGKGSSSLWEDISLLLRMHLCQWLTWGRQLDHPNQCYWPRWEVWQAAHPHIRRQLKTRLRYQARNIDWRAIYKEEMLEAKGKDENSTDMNQNQEWTLGCLYI